MDQLMVFCECLFGSVINMVIVGISLNSGALSISFIIWRFVVNMLWPKTTNSDPNSKWIILSGTRVVFAIMTFTVVYTLNVSTFQQWPEKTIAINWMAIAWATLIVFRRTVTYHRIANRIAYYRGF